eukprot:GHVS01003126.1.p1 GENE.GHVS01003126.1~~GHVS01003126.1.p1  ORF type:complete len:122 (-),score=5.25 GHVS01003126.1:406-771(-)
MVATSRLRIPGKSLKPKSNRLYTKAVFTGYRRSKSNQYPDCALLELDGVRTLEDSKFYIGKKVAYVYKAKTVKNGSKFRVIWGKIRRSHGNKGMVRAKFITNMPSSAMGNRVRVMLYPSRV